MKSVPEIVCEQWPPSSWLGHSVLVAVSGGPDSVALLRALHKIRQDHKATGAIIVGHIDHQLRNNESAADAEFVAELARKLQLPFELRLADPPRESASGQSVEGVLRNRRYELLAGIAHETGCRYLCTGHQADDQAETVLFRILRGTGLDGLRGIPPRRVMDDAITLCRPLLTLRRQQLIDWLRATGQTWRSDSSNLTGNYTRNRIRNELLPQIANFMNGDPVEALCDLATTASEIHDYLNEQAERLSCWFVRHGAHRIDVDLVALANESEFLVRHAIRQAWSEMGWPKGQMTRARWLHASAILKNGPVRERISEDFPDGIRLVVSGSTASFQRGSGN